MQQGELKAKSQATSAINAINTVPNPHPNDTHAYIHTHIRNRSGLPVVMSIYPCTLVIRTHTRTRGCYFMVVLVQVVGITFLFFSSRFAHRVISSLATALLRPCPVHTHTYSFRHAPVWPDWTTGFWQCKLRYANQTQIMAVANEYVRRQIPISLIIIDFFSWNDPVKKINTIGDVSVEIYSFFLLPLLPLLPLFLSSLHSYVFFIFFTTSNAYHNAALASSNHVA